MAKKRTLKQINKLIEASEKKIFKEGCRLKKLKDERDAQRKAYGKMYYDAIYNPDHSHM